MVPSTPADAPSAVAAPLRDAETHTCTRIKCTKRCCHNREGHRWPNGLSGAQSDFGWTAGVDRCRGNDESAFADHMPVTADFNQWQKFKCFLSFLHRQAKGNQKIVTSIVLI